MRRRGQCNTLFDHGAEILPGKDAGIYGVQHKYTDDTVGSAVSNTN